LCHRLDCVLVIPKSDNFGASEVAARDLRKFLAFPPVPFCLSPRTFISASSSSPRQERLLCGRQLSAVVSAREQVAVGVRRHLNRGVAEARLPPLERQFESAVEAPVDAPRGVEVPEAVQAGIFRLAVAVDHACRYLRRMKPTLDDRVAVLDSAPAVR